MKNFAFGVTVFPFSWAFGVWKKPHKTLLSIGPIRFVRYRISKEWKQD